MRSISNGRRELTVTEGHLKLVRRFVIRWEDSGYLGAPAVDIKRPYGNSSILQDVAEILGWEAASDGELSEEQKRAALEIHQQMADVLEIIIQTERFRPGRYVQPGWGREWEPTEK